MNRRTKWQILSINVFVLIVFTLTACLGNPPKNNGVIQVAFSGLPGPWTEPGQGYVTLKSTSNFERNVFTEDAITNLAPGQYALTAHPLTLCEVTYAASELTTVVQVSDDKTTKVEVKYEPVDSLLLPQYRAKVSGADTNDEFVEGDVSMLRDGEVLNVFGCIAASKNIPKIPADLFAEASIYQGNVFDHYAGTTKEMAKLGFTLNTCDANEGKRTVENACARFISGSLQLNDDQLTAFDTGNTYLVLKGPDNYFISPLGPERLSPRGGKLNVVIKDAQNVPPSQSFKICLDGFYNISAMSLLRNRLLPIPCFGDVGPGPRKQIRYTSQDKSTFDWVYTFIDLFAGSYNVITDVTLTDHTDFPGYAPDATKVTVKSGETTTVTFTKK